MARLRMMNDTILVKPDEEQYFDENPEIARILSEGKITLPDKYVGFFKKAPTSGEVVSCGPHCKQGFKEGDRIIYVRFGGAPFHWEKEKYRILREYEVLAKEEA